jgi:hypothetical protein
MSTRLKCRRSLQLVSVLSKRRAANTLIRVRCLLNHHLLVPALARAATHAQCPKQARGYAEGNADPHDLQHLVAHRGFNVVGFERGVKDASEDAVDGSGG